jgi:hypothetical protein
VDARNRTYVAKTDTDTWGRNNVERLSEGGRVGLYGFMLLICIALIGTGLWNKTFHSEQVCCTSSCSSVTVVLRSMYLLIRPSEGGGIIDLSRSTSPALTKISNFELVANGAFRERQSILRHVYYSPFLHRGGFKDWVGMGRKNARNQIPAVASSSAYQQDVALSIY